MAVTDEAILKIKAMIVSGELGPGSRLPPESELAQALGLSRNSLREAVKALAVMHILDVRQGDGTYVTSLAPDRVLEALSFVVDFHADHTVQQILEVRRVLEPYATAKAATMVTPEQSVAIYAACDAVAEATTVEDLVRTDMAFHRLIAEASGNDYLAGLLDSLSGPTVRARIWRGISEGQAVERTHAEHRAIADAVSGHRPEIAHAWATVHVAGVEAWLANLSEHAAVAP